jgi:hypothetical protein
MSDDPVSMDPDDDDASAKPPGPRMASSLATARYGDLLAFDRRGRVLSRRRVRVRTALSWLWFGAVMAFVGAFWGGLAHSVVVGLISGGAVSAIFLRRWRRNRRAYRAMLRAGAALSVGRLETARAALAPLAGKDVEGSIAFMRDYLDARIDWMAGSHEVAEGKYQRLCRGRPRDARLASEHTWLLAIQSRAADAHALLEAAPKPLGDFQELGRVGAELRLAFLDDALPAAFDSERLHRYAREVLSASMFGSTCILLAWAFEQRGDPDMADHLCAEAPARLGQGDLSRFDPALLGWFTMRACSPPR